MAGELKISVAPSGTETGIWCDRCALPSAVRWTLVGLAPGFVLDLGDLTVCADCDDETSVARWQAELVARALGGDVVGW